MHDRQDRYNRYDMHDGHYTQKTNDTDEKDDMHNTDDTDNTFDSLENKRRIQRVTIIGHGSVGSALRDQFQKEGTLYSVWDRKAGACEPPKIDSRGRELKNARRTGPKFDNDLGDWIFLSVPDGALETVVQQLLELPCSWAQRTVVHLSGMLSPDLLRPLAEKGAGTGSIHPLQTFSGVSSRKSLQGIFYSLMGDPETIAAMAEWVTALRGKSTVVSQKQKEQLHLAAVFASNYMMALFHVADDLLENDIRFDVLEPILETTLHNALAKGPESALSGPVRRGDAGTVQKHLSMLASDPLRHEMYRLLGLEALNITEKAEPTPDPEKAANLAVLKEILSRGLA